MATSEIPGPPQPFWQQLRQIRQDFLGFILAAGREYGDLVRLHPGPGTWLYLVNHPDLVYEVLVTRQEQFHKSAMTRKMVGKFLGNGLILSEDLFHRQQRRLMQPAFHRQRIAAYVEKMGILTQRQVDSWAHEQVIDFEAEMTELTMHIVAMSLFGLKPSAADDEVGRIMEVFGDSISRRFRSLPLPDWLPTKAHREQRQAIAEMDRIIVQMISERRRAAVDDGDLLSMLLMSKDEDTGQGMDETQIRDEIVTLYFAGHETTAQLLTWVVYLLLKHPAVAHSVQKELQATLTDHHSPSLEELRELELLDQVIKETLRLYPPAWVFDRTPVEDVDLGGFRLPAGSTLYISPYVAHRDPRYFSEPDRFDPGRFASGWEQRLPRYAYYPFGGGPRLCIGQAFAEMEAKIVLATLLSQVNLEALWTTPVVPEPVATLRPQVGLPVKVSKFG